MENIVKCDESNICKWIFEFIPTLKIDIDGEKKELERNICCSSIENSIFWKDQIVDQQQDMKSQAEQIKSYESKGNRTKSRFCQLETQIIWNGSYTTVTEQTKASL